MGVKVRGNATFLVPDDQRVEVRTKMKIVFLDFDGVLNSHEYIRNRAPENERGSRIGLDRVAVARVNRLLAETGAEVVVSSTWRHGKKRTQLCDILNDVGFVGVVRGMTPEWLTKTPGGIYAAKCRGEEIQAWLDNAAHIGHDVESFVIVDDDSDMAHLAYRLIKTSFETGLLDEHVDRAIGMLREPPMSLIKGST